MRVRRVGLIAAALSLAMVAPVAAITYPDTSAPNSGKVTPTEAPWVVGLWSVDGDGDREPQTDHSGNFCTGALIGPFTIVTAAHCADLMQIGSFVAVQGATKRPDRGHVLLPRAVRIPANYIDATKSNDIAVVDLYEPATARSYLRLPSPDISRTVLAKTSPTLYGWGNDQTLAPSKYLRRAKLNDMTPLAKLLWPSISVYRQVAAGRANSNGTFTAACTGDSGGPLVGALPGKSTKYLIGTVSFGASVKCNRKTPTVFTRVAAYVSWIKRMQGEFAAERSAAGIDISRVAYNGLLPVTSGVTDTGVAYRTSSAEFRTQTDQVGEFDLTVIQVFSYAQPVNGLDVEVRIKSKLPWPADGCGWRDLGTAGGASPATVVLAIQDPVSQLTGTLVGLQLGRCLTRPLGLVPVQVRGQLSASCVAKAAANPDGSNSFWLPRTCLPLPAAAAFRVSYESGIGKDLVPGLDAWAGPFDLTSP